MRGGGLMRLIGAYLAIGTLWCLLVNLYDVVVGHASAFAVLEGTMATTDKVFEVAGIIGREVFLWPVDLYQAVIRPLVG